MRGFEPRPRPHKTSCVEKPGEHGRPRIIQYALSTRWLKP